MTHWRQKWNKHFVILLPPLFHVTSVNIKLNQKVITDLYEELFKCEYCDFVGKTEGGLKTHTRCKHTKKMVQFNYQYCTLCNFNSKTEMDLIGHMETCRTTHSNLNYNTHRQQVDADISKMTNRGFVFTTLKTIVRQIDYLQKNAQSNYYSGKGPR